MPSICSHFLYINLFGKAISLPISPRLREFYFYYFFLLSIIYNFLTPTHFKRPITHIHTRSLKFCLCDPRVRKKKVTQKVVSLSFSILQSTGDSYVRTASGIRACTHLRYLSLSHFLSSIFSTFTTVL